MVLPIRISEAMAAEWVMPEQPIVSTSASWMTPFLDVERQLAGALLRRAPADAVRKTGNVLDFLGLHPLALFGDGSRDHDTRPWQPGTYADFRSVNHKILPFSENT
jgi:hypothetical protein